MKLEKKAIPGYEGKYHLDPDTMSVVNSKTGRPRKIRLDSGGYAEVDLWKNNKSEHKLLHRLFAEAYIPNPDNLPEINHKDENPANYQLDNLEWCTHKYNINYGTANERRGENISKAMRGKPKPWVAEQRGKAVIAIDSEGNETLYPSYKEAARQIGNQPSDIQRILAGERKTSYGYKFRRP